MQIEWDAPIEMDDGVVLRADVFRPDGDGTHPVILSYGPYAKGLVFQEGYPNQWERMVSQHPDVAAGSSNRYQNWEVVDPEKWVPDGYVCVRVDSRGAGRSPGRLDPFSPRETRDLAACIEWAAAQPWSTGRVGLNGISYYAMNQWHVAGHRPRGLTAMCAWEGASDWYRDATRHGGILCTFFGNWYEMQVTTVQHGLGSRGPVNPNTGEEACGPETLSDLELAARRTDFGADVAAHELDGDYHRARSGDWDRIAVPLLSAGNWGGHGLHLRGNVEGYVRSASRQKWLELHGLEHWTHFYTDYGVRLQKRFFGHFLKGEDTGWESQPPVLLQVRHADGTFIERGEQEWPPARTEWTRLHLDAGRHALAATAGDGSTSYEALGEGLTFMGAPLERETEITGPSAAKLFVSSSTPDADLFVVLRAFDPEGEEVVFQGAIDPHTPLAQGWLRASHRKLEPELSEPYRPYHTHDEKQPLTPGEVYELDVEIWPTSIVLPAGYCLALTVRGTDYEYPHAGGDRLTTFRNELRGSGPFLHDDPDDRPPEIFGGTVTVHPGSYVLLPFVPAP
ncbi:MAG TPA: CocE/NonD family hydrolase [Thermoleophilaceae bacterium]|nr:CocE/NonD family hydrolase [Thermoleophilaceae bacterium]